MSLSVEDLKQIVLFVEKSSISRSQMRENLIDHLCCSVENKIEEGIPFETALDLSLRELAPNGLNEIEYETYLLLNLKSITMKKLSYSSGLFFSVCASIGLFFKVLHWAGANELLIIGFGGLAAIFVPLLVIIRKSDEKSAQEKALLISLMLISIGAVLKVFHFAGANEALLLGTAAFSLGFLPLMFLNLYRKSMAI